MKLESQLAASNQEAQDAWTAGAEQGATLGALLINHPIPSLTI